MRVTVDGHNRNISWPIVLRPCFPYNINIYLKKFVEDMVVWRLCTARRNAFIKRLIVTQIESNNWKNSFEFIEKILLTYWLNEFLT